ncbi:hypothetical protein BDN72DRAFT_906870 [Pluteus cervinus]|uniref:Uncharacterized protein n=1 Tax=Pluteus cervinus TaxID=181527 RepID=A0ACD2ZY04_9AGAR|nr:hypothetical protein BDN72DRAFT_906870 [Pluteus cervinus]
MPSTHQTGQHHSSLSSGASALNTPPGRLIPPAVATLVAGVKCIVRLENHISAFPFDYPILSLVYFLVPSRTWSGSQLAGSPTTQPQGRHVAAIVICLRSADALYCYLFLSCGFRFCHLLVLLHYINFGTDLTSA